MIDLDLDKFDGFGSDEDMLKDAMEPVSEKQKTMIYSLLGELGMDKYDMGIDKVSSLTRKEASILIEDLLDMKENQDIEDFNDDLEDYFDEIGEDLDF